jgi:hypothetical protein
MASNNLQLTIEFLLKNKEQLVELFKKLNQKYGLDLDTSDLESAFSELDKVSDQEVSLTADGSQAIDEADQVEEEVQQVPEQKKTTFMADAQQALQVGANLYLSFQAVIGVVKQINALISEFIEKSNIQEMAEQRLATVMKATVEATEEQIHALESYAAQLQKITTIGDEATISGQSQIATFNMQADSVATLTPALQTLAVASYGVNVSSEQMIQSANLLGKAFMGQTGALSRVGISFTEAQGKMLKMGNEQERVQVITEVINKNFGDLAQEMATTYPGQVAQLTNTFGDMQEHIGTLLKVALLPLVSLLGKLAGVAEEFFRALTETSLQTTIRQLEEMGASTTALFKLKRLAWKYELDEVNSKLQQAKIEYTDLDDLSKTVSDNEDRRATLLEEIASLEVETNSFVVDSNALKEKGYNAMVGEYDQFGLTLSRRREELRLLDDEQAIYLDNISLIQQAELLQSKINQDITEIKDNVDDLDAKQPQIDIKLNIDDEDVNLGDLTGKVDQQINDSIAKSNQAAINASLQLAQKRLNIINQMKVNELDLAENFRAAELEKLKQEYDQKLALFSESSVQYQQIQEQRKQEEQQINDDFDALEIEKAAEKYDVLKDIAFSAIDEMFEHKNQRSIEDIELDMELNEAQYEQQVADVNRRIAEAQREGNSTRLLLLQKQKLEKDYNKNQTKLEKEREQASKSTMGKMADAVKAGIKEVIKAKAAEASAWVFTKVMKVVPFPANLVAAPIAAGTAYAAGIAIAEKFGEGGTPRGKKHSQGGIIVEVEDQEEIIKASRAKKYRPALKFINNAPESEIDKRIDPLMSGKTSGSSYPTKTVFADGGTVNEVQPSSHSDLSYQFKRLIELQNQTIEVIKAFNLNFLEETKKKTEEIGYYDFDLEQLIYDIDEKRIQMVNANYTGHVDRILIEMFSDKRLKVFREL